MWPVQGIWSWVGFVILKLLWVLRQTKRKVETIILIDLTLNSSGFIILKKPMRSGQCRQWLGCRSKGTDSHNNGQWSLVFASDPCKCCCYEDRYKTLRLNYKTKLPNIHGFNQSSVRILCIHFIHKLSFIFIVLTNILWKSVMGFIIFICFT